MKKVKKYKTKDQRLIDVVKAARKGSREAELQNSTGWKTGRKVHKDRSKFNRKKKHKKLDI